MARWVPKAKLGYVGLVATKGTGFSRRRGLSLLAVAGLLLPLSLPITEPPPALAAFPGANGKIAFITFGSGLSVMDPDGSNAGTLIEGDAAYPVWSPDGTKVAFHRDGDIWVVISNGREERNLTNHPKGGQWPAWSPDGTKIAFSRPGKNAMNIWVMRADGTHQKKLGRGWVPAWSPDGRKIAFHCCATADRHDIYVMNADGSHRRQLTNDSTPFDYDPDWSPNGKKIVFDAIYPSKTGPPPRIEIWVMNADGTGKQVLTDDPADVATRNMMPAWSPDGTKIVFASTADNPEDGTTPEIWVMNADGSDRRQLTQVEGAAQADWQPACTATGTKHDDTLTGTEGRDLICGLGGDDVISGLGGNDVIFGGDGNDTISGGADNDILVGGRGDDSISGGRGDDRLVGGPGADVLVGGNGRDRCAAGARDTSRGCV